MTSTEHTPQFVIVDCETNGLDRKRHIAVEIAYWNLSTGERDCFIPSHDVSEALCIANIKALQVNRYVDRIADQPQDDGTRLAQMAAILDGNTLAGANPGFDRDFVWGAFRELELREGYLDWFEAPTVDYHMWDLENYAAGVLGLPRIPRLREVCEALGITAPDHTAEGDVTATGRAFLALFERAGIEVPGKVAPRDPVAQWWAAALPDGIGHA